MQEDIFRSFLVLCLQYFAIAGEEIIHITFFFKPGFYSVYYIGTIQRFVTE